MASTTFLTPVPKLVSKPPYTLDVPGQTPVQGETPVRRTPTCINGLHDKPANRRFGEKETIGEEITTIYKLVKWAALAYGDSQCMGSRKLVNTHVETKKVKKMVDGEEREVDKNWTYFELGHYEFITFKEYEQRTLDVGAGLRALGLNAGDRVHIFAATSQNWLAMSHGAASQSMPIVTAYDTLGAEGLKYSMVATKAKAIFLDPHLLPTLNGVLEHAKDITHVIWNNQNKAKDAHIEQLRTERGVTVLNFDELVQLGKQNPVAPVPPSPEDLCCIMYTSGSTGTPKGVPLKHSNVVAAGKFVANLSFCA